MSEDMLSVVAKNVVNLYISPDNSSEQISQAILGQPAWVEVSEGDWCYIRTWDNYHGWAQSRWILPIEGGQPYGAGERTVRTTDLYTDILTEPDSSSDIITKAVIDSTLEVADEIPEWYRVRLPDGKEGFVVHWAVEHVRPEETARVSGDKLVKTAKRFIGIPYLWGGTTTFGIDCSGFVQLVYHIHGITLPRDAYMQADDPRFVPVDRADFIPGDLLFFASRKEDCEKITHVAISMGKDEFIHSSSGIGVNLAALTDVKYNRIFWGARRLILTEHR